MSIDIDGKVRHPRGIMDEIGSVNIFFSEGVGANEIIVEKETAGEEMGCDSFGYVKLDSIDPGQ